jgi:hypothetical protein
MAKAKRRKRSGGASGHASVRGGLKARTPFLRAGTQDHGTSWGTKSTPSRGLGGLSRERIPTLWVWYEGRNSVSSIEVNRDWFKEWESAHR